MSKRLFSGSRRLLPLSLICWVVLSGCSKQDETKPLSVELPDDVRLAHGETRHAEISIQGGEAPYSIEILSGKAELNGRQVILSADSGTVVLKVSDQKGSVAFDEIEVVDSTPPLEIEAPDYAEIGQDVAVGIRGAIGTPVLTVFSGNATVKDNWYVLADSAGSIVLKVEDELGRSSFKPLLFHAPLGITTESYMHGRRYVMSYHERLKLVPTGGVPPYRFEMLEQETTAVGVRFDPETGVLISGSEPGKVSIRYTDASGTSGVYREQIEHTIGSLVSTFGTDGLVSLPRTERIRSLAAIGHNPSNDDLFPVLTTFLSERPYHIRVLRMNKEGQPVRFSERVESIEIVEPEAHEYTDFIRLVLSPDGKLVILTGYADKTVVERERDKPKEDRDSPVRHRVYRFNTDGTPDLSFNEVGYVEAEYENWLDPVTVLVQPDRKILVIGEHVIAHPDESVKFLQTTVATRFTESGILDESFGEGGRLTIPLELATTGLGRGSGQLAAIQRTDSGFRVLVTGRHWPGDDLPSWLARDYHKYEVGVFAMDESGKPDESFGQNGLATVDIGHRPLPTRFGERDSRDTLSQYGESVIPLPKGRMLITGNSWNTPYVLLLSSEGKELGMEIFHEHFRNELPSQLFPFALADGSVLLRLSDRSFAEERPDTGYFHHVKIVDREPRRIEFGGTELVTDNGGTDLIISDRFDQWSSGIKFDEGPKKYAWWKTCDSVAVPAVLTSGEIVFGGLYLTMITGPRPTEVRSD